MPPQKCQLTGPAPRLDFTPGERLNLMKPVDTLSYLQDAAAGKCVLDIGCLDETALIKLDTPDWVHGRLARVARRITGVDKSDLVPEDGLLTPAGVIQHGDINSIKNAVMPDAEVVFVCNLIEHLENPIGALTNIHKEFPSAEVVILTPNATCLTNVGLACMRRESMHADHVAIFSYKTLTTLMIRAGYDDFRIIPSHTHYPEAIRRLQGWRRRSVKVLETSVRTVEKAIPMLSAGFIVHTAAVPGLRS